MTAADWDMLAIGQPSVDVVLAQLPAWPRLGGDVFARQLGVCAGTSFNTPAAANRLGLRVGYVSMIGNDMWSRMVLGEYESEHMPTNFLRVHNRPMPFVSVAMNFDGDRGFVSYKGATEEDERELHAFATDVVSVANARHLHASVARQSTEILEIARRRDMTISLDSWDGPWPESLSLLEPLLAPADILFVNEREALAMTGEHEPRTALARLAEICACVVMKQGAHGATAIADGTMHTVSAEPGNVVDTTGAGDCFNAGFLLGWLSRLPLEHCLTLGAICGAAAVEAFGGYLNCPRRPEIAKAAAERGIELPTYGEQS